MNNKLWAATDWVERILDSKWTELAIWIVIAASIAYFGGTIIINILGR